MKYTTGRAFRQALEDKLRSEPYRHRIPRLRKMITFERFMARLDEKWVLKGGYALQLRSEKARYTQDIDLAGPGILPQEVISTLQATLRQDLKDYFEFYLEQVEPPDPYGGVVRVNVTTRLAGRIFERFHVDIGLHDPILDPVEYLTPPSYLDFAGISSVAIPCYPVTQQIAEKIHALVRPRPAEHSRVKDFIDILLFATLDTQLQSDRLFAAIQAVFRARGDDLPDSLDVLPGEWNLRFAQQARGVGLPFTNYSEAMEAFQAFINPVLKDPGKATWNPIQWTWKESEE